MKKSDPDIQDIYRSEDLNPEKSTPARKTPELIERELRRQLIFNVSVGLLSLALVAFLTTSIVKNYLFVPEKTTSSGTSRSFLAAHTLPANEQWAMDYRQVALQADNSEASGPKDFSTKWVKNAAYHIIMGEHALRLNELPAAQDHLGKALYTFPETTGIHRDLGTAYLKQQNFEKAVEQLQKAQEEQPSVELLNNLGVAYLGTMNYERAEDLFRQALQQNPNLAGCYKNLALLYQKTSRTNEAVVFFEKYFALNPQDTALIQNYTAYLTTVGRPRDAVAFLGRLKGADSLAVSLLLAKAAAQDSDAESAIRALREAARFLTPRQMIEEMHDAAFYKIARTEPFEAFLYRLELASVSLSTNLDVKGESKN